MGTVLLIVALIGLLVASLFGALYAFFWSSDKKPPVKFGVHLICAIPGSGKSYYAVLKMIEHVYMDRRVIYTNIPVIHSMLKAYCIIKYKNRKLANFIRVIEKDHFLRFCERVELINKHASEIADRLREDVTLDKPEEEVEKQAVMEARELCKKLYGPEKISGSMCNWVPVDSIMMLDELHKWVGSKDQKNESPAVLNYLSMHRHFQHMIYCISQDARNVTVSVRRMAETITYCKDASKVKFLWFLPFPVQMFCYSTYHTEDMTSDFKPNRKASPLKTRYEIPMLTGKKIFKLYRSFSHGGSQEALDKEKYDTKCAVSGMTKEEIQEREKRIEKQNQQIKKFAKYGSIGLVAVVVVAILVVVIWRPFRSFGVMGGAAIAEEKKNTQADQHTKQVTITSPDGTRQVVNVNLEQTQENKSLRITGINRKGVIIEGTAIYIGQSYRGAILQAVSVTRNQAYFNHRGVIIVVGFDGVRSIGKARNKQ